MGIGGDCERANRTASEHNHVTQGLRLAGRQYFQPAPQSGSRRSHLRSQPEHQRLFQPSSVPSPSYWRWGNLGRYIANGPGMFEVDSSLQKRFKVTERLGLDFRAAAYNLFNHPIYKTPSGSIGSLSGNPPSVSGGFGRITSIINTGAVGTGAPRRIEFMLRAEF